MLRTLSRSEIEYVSGGDKPGVVTTGSEGLICLGSAGAAIATDGLSLLINGTIAVGSCVLAGKDIINSLLQSGDIQPAPISVDTSVLNNDDNVTYGSDLGGSGGGGNFDDYEDGGFMNDD